MPQMEIGSKRFWTLLVTYGFALPVMLIVVCSIAIPASIGAIAIIIEQDFDYLSSHSGTVAAGSIGLAILTTTLASAANVIDTRRTSADLPDVPNWITRLADPKLVRTFFFLAAACFALFALLTPFLAARAKEINFYPADNFFATFMEEVTAYIGVTSLILGSVVVGFAIALSKVDPISWTGLVQS